MLKAVQNDGSNSDENLPSDGTAFALAFMAATMERRFPGFLDDWERLATDPTVHAEIRKLREPPISPELTRSLREAVSLVRHTRLVTLAWIAERKLRKRREP